MNTTHPTRSILLLWILVISMQACTCFHILKRNERSPSYFDFSEIFELISSSQRTNAPPPVSSSKPETTPTPTRTPQTTPTPTRTTETVSTSGIFNMPGPNVQAQRIPLMHYIPVDDTTRLREEYEEMWKAVERESGMEGQSKIDILGHLFKKNVHELRSVSNQQVELVFLVDSSSSVGVDNFFNELKFVKKLLADFTVAQWATRVAIITFSSRHRVNIVVDQISRPSEENNKCSLLNEQLPTISYVGGGTHTLGAFLKAQKVLQHARPNSTQAVFLITDGYSNGGDPQPSAEVLRNKGVEIFTFGIQNGNVRELLSMASKPSVEHCYILDSFEEFEALARRALHEDLYVGGYVQENRTKCSTLCRGDGDCCDVLASCQCGTHTGQYECVCPPGYHGSGLQNGCIACPSGTFKPISQPGGISTCLPCPSQYHLSPEGSSDISHCVCQEGFMSIDDNLACAEITCPRLSQPENGFFLTGVCSNKFHKACAIQCNDGYVVANESIRVCQADGTWTGTELLCEKLRCSPLQAPQNGNITCTTDDFTFDTICAMQCDYGFNLIGSQYRRCMQIASEGSWDGLPASCRRRTCSPIEALPHGFFHPMGCSKRRSQFGQRCRLSCEDGYTRMGSKTFVCGPEGDWTKRHDTKSECIDITVPTITCPDDIITETLPNRNYANVFWAIPQPEDEGSAYPTLKVSPSVTSGMQFEIGITNITYTAVDHANNTAQCTFSIIVTDTQSPTVEVCRSPPVIYASSRQQTVQARLEAPVFSDNSGVAVEVIPTHSTESFSIGATNLEYIGRDSSGNVRSCIIRVDVQKSSCVIPSNPRNGVFNCVPLSDGGLNCTIECNPGYQFSSLRSTNYVCRPDGSWIPRKMPRRKCHATFAPFSEQTISLAFQAANCSEATTWDVKKTVRSQLNSKLESICGINSQCDIINITSHCIQHPIRTQSLTTESYDPDDPTYHVQSLKSIAVSPNMQVIVSIRGMTPVGEEDISGSNVWSVEYPSIYSVKPLHVTTIGTDLVCGDGSVMTDTKECVPCDSGMYYDAARQTCEECPKGFYQPLDGQVMCISCDNGMSTVDSGSTSSTQCKGFCQPGTWSNSGLEQCENCPLGSYQPKWGATECLQCASNTTTVTSRSTSVTSCVEPCSPGFSSSTGLQPCLPCPTGTYQTQANQTTCILCPNNGTTLSKSSVSLDDCEVFNVTSRLPVATLQIPFTPCFSDPCQNKGTCGGSAAGIFCECAPGFEGFFCEEEIDECSFNSCLNNGTCEDGVGSFQCACQPGFTGNLCEENIDECQSNPCLMNGTCLDEVDGYTCECNEGHEGIHCGVKVDVCASNPCQNNATCKDHLGAYFCTCSPGYHGNQCEFDDNECLLNPCENEAVCINLPGSFRCNCQPGYQGIFCQRETNECEKVSCLNNGTCEDRINDFKCFCKPGYGGKQCEEELPWNYTLGFRRRGTTDYSILRGEDFFRGQSIRELTISFWMRTNDSAYYGTPFSYAVGQDANDLTLTDYNGFVPTVNGKKRVTDVTANDGIWHHIALTWNSGYGEWGIFKDGVLREQGFNLSVGQPVHGGGDFVLGQEQDSKGGDFNPVESFVGDITWLNIWSRVLRPEEIERQSQACDKPTDAMIVWPSFMMGIVGEVEVLDNNFCKGCPEPVPYTIRHANSTGYLEGVPLHTINYTCSHGYEIRYGATSSQCQISGDWFPTEIPECLPVYCQYPRQIRNGRFFLHRGPDSGTPYFDSEIRYQCDESFTMIGNKTRVCQKNKLFSGHEPVCVNSECGDVPNVQHGSPSHHRSAGPNLEVIFTCSQGYHVIGNSIVRCLENGTWSPLPRCEKIRCKVLMHPVHATTNITNGEEVGSVISFSCLPGYHLVGSPSLKCSTNGLWTGEPGLCQPIPCKPFPPIPHSNFSSGTFRYHSNVAVVCNDGFVLSGRSVISCFADGSWPLPLPRCDRMNCGNAPVIPNSFPVAQKNYYFEESISFVCLHGYKLNGSGILTCTSTGIWSPSPPSCIQINCGVPPEVANASPVLSGSLLGDTLMYECIQGYQLINDSILTCSGDSEWQPAPPRCEPVSCDKPPFVSNALHHANSFVFESIVSYSCKEGYVLVGPSILTCLFNKSWNPSPPKCLPVSCGNPPSVPNSVPNFDSSFYLSVANYDCFKGYILSGSSSLTCTASGSWDPLPPVCNPVECGTPPRFDHASVIRGTYYYGSNVSYECDSGYIRESSLQLACNSEGLWEGHPVSCVPVSCGDPPQIDFGITMSTSGLYMSDVIYTCVSGYSIATSYSLFCNASGFWEGTFPVCTPVDCGDPTQIIHGSLRLDSTTYGRTAEYSCDKGYDLYGEASVECMESGVWEPIPPSCNPVFCRHPLSIDNGYFDGMNFHFNHTIQYYCNDGFSLRGSPESTCLYNRMWSSQIPSCVPISCPTPILPNGYYEGENHVFSQVVQFACNSGYNLMGSRLATCLASGEWDQIPSCDPVLCHPPDEVENGNLFVKSLHYGSTASYSCWKGYLLQGNDTLSCLSSALWSSSPPTCERVMCVTPPILPNTKIVGNRVNYYYGDAVSLHCSKGYRSVTLVNSSMECLSSGNWSAVSPPLLCTRKMCPLPWIPNSINSRPYFFNDSVSVQCIEGYYVNDSITSTCLANGKWKPHLPSCLPVSCDPAPPIINGRKLMDNTLYNKSVIYVCDIGYRLKGNSTLTCQSDRNWSDHVPSCKPVSCDRPPDFKNGLVIGEDFTYNQSVIFTCMSGFNLEGSSSSVCLSDGTWSSIPPTCEEASCYVPEELDHGVVIGSSLRYMDTIWYACNPGYYMDGAVSRICLPPGLWTGNKPTCYPLNCGIPSTSHGSSFWVTGHTFNNTAIYSCERGYIQVGPGIARCNESGAWEGVDVSYLCEPLNCGVPPAFRNALFEGTSFTLRSVVRYFCEEGFNLIGPSSLICDYDGSWFYLDHPNSLVEPHCVPITCETPPVLFNGHFLDIDYSFNSSIYYYCNEGFLLKGVAHSTCLANGTWSPLKARCEPITCAPPALVRNAHMYPNLTLYQYMGTVRYSCKSGYRFRSGDKYSTCIGLDLWNGSTPHCGPVYCGRAPQVAFANVFESGVYFRHKARYSCRPGYRLTGSREKTCTAQGVWMPNSTLCAPVWCGNPQEIENGQFMFSGVTYGNIANYSCHTGYRLHGEQVQTCNLHGQWWGAQSPLCLPVECPSPGAIENGYMNTSLTLVYQSEVEYSCYSGFRLTGSSVLQCQADGTWSRVKPECVIVTCPLRPGIENGSYQMIPSNSANSTIHYSCEEGFILQGLANQVCLPNGRWNTKPPRCVRVTCSSLREPFGGTITLTGSTYQSQATYVCDEGYILIGPSARECLSTGQWSGRSPFCRMVQCGAPPVAQFATVPELRGREERTTFYYQHVLHYHCLEGYFHANGSTSVCSADGSWQPQNIECHRYDCGDPPRTSNTILSYNTTTFNSEVFYSCPSGFYLKGEALLVCGPEGEWSTPSPTCERMKCPDLKEPSQGQIELTGTLFEDEANVRCNYGYGLKGNSTLFCTSKGIWDSPMPTCEEAICPEPEPLENGMRIIRNRRQGPLRRGSAVFYSCDNSFTLVGSAQRHCLQNGSWSGTAPTCREVQALQLKKQPVCVLPCLNGGRCVAPYQCQCPYAFTGNRCERAICTTRCATDVRNCPGKVRHICTKCKQDGTC